MKYFEISTGYNQLTYLWKKGEIKTYQSKMQNSVPNKL